MLSGTTIARAILMLIAAAGAIGLVNAYWSRGDEPAETPAIAVPADTTNAEATKANEPPPAPAPVPEPARPPEPAPVADATPSQQVAPPAPPPAVAPEEPKPAAPVSTEANAPAAAALLDLNQASAADLTKLGERNKLKGVPAFSKAVIKGRPYKSVEELSKRKIVNKAKYDRIKDQVTVR